MREDLTRVRRLVVKIGSSLLTNNGAGLDRPALQGWVAQIAALVGRGCEVVLVSSGAVACGLQRLGMKTRPRALHQLQALAAVGQMGLIEAYETAFASHGRQAAQVLLTHDDLADRRRYLNARSALRSLLAMTVVPVINENDTVATEEIRFGDNDTLAALVANLIEAELLVILTDQTGLHDRDPRAHADARLVEEGVAGDVRLLEMAGGAGSLGRGGMRTKLTAAAKAARSGAATVICAGREPDVLMRVLAGEVIGTCLRPVSTRWAARKQWLAARLSVRGQLVLDAGAVRVVREAGRSLLPVGIQAVRGDFARGEMVACVDAEGREVARGLVNYGASEIEQIRGHASDDIERLLGYTDEPEVIHRDNLVLV
ncbi:MAG: glutamate 5-kinase [Gammaproteobacteria bacterium]|nr:glutamate 5-kinase [Gammaproteobacteria bacterium]